MALTRDDAFEKAMHPDFKDNDAIQATLTKVTNALHGYWDRGNIEEAKRRAALVNEIRMYYGLQKVGMPHLDGQVLTNETLESEGIEEVNWEPEEKADIENKGDYASTKGAGGTKRSDTVSETYREQVPEDKKEVDESDTATVVTDDPTEYAQEPYLTDYPGLDDAGYNEGQGTETKTQGEATGFTSIEDFDPAPMLSQSQSGQFKQERGEGGQFTGGLYDPESRKFARRRSKVEVQRSRGETSKFSSVGDLTEIKGIGEATAEKLRENGIQDVAQLRLEVKNNPSMLESMSIAPFNRKRIKQDLGV